MKIPPPADAPLCPRCDAAPAAMYVYGWTDRPTYYCRSCQKNFYSRRVRPQKEPSTPRVECSVEGCSAIPGAHGSTMCFPHRHAARVKEGRLRTAADRERYRPPSVQRKARREATLARIGRECRWCGEDDESLLQIDHILEQQLHPELIHDPSNLQPLCRPCHTAKTAATRHGILEAARLLPEVDAIVERHVAEARSNRRTNRPRTEKAAS